MLSVDFGWKDYRITRLKDGKGKRMEKSGVDIEL